MGLNDQERYELLDSLQTLARHKEIMRRNAKKRKKPDSYTQQNANIRNVTIAEPRSDGVAVVSSGKEGNDMHRRVVLKAAGALVIAPYTELGATPHYADCYGVVKSAAESVGSRLSRLSELEQADHLCLRLVQANPTRTSQRIAGMAASQHAIMRSYFDPVRALDIAHRAVVHAVSAGDNVIQLWAANAEASAYMMRDDLDGAIRALQRVIGLRPEQGTMQVFALSSLIGLFAKAGDTQRTLQTADLIERARDQVRIPDEFEGMMAFPVEQQYGHVSRALYRIGEYERAISLAEHSLGMYSDVAEAELRDSGYVIASCLTIAASACELGQNDCAEHFARRAMMFDVTDSERAFILPKLHARGIAPELCA